MEKCISIYATNIYITHELRCTYDVQCPHFGGVVRGWINPHEYIVHNLRVARLFSEWYSLCVARTSERASGRVYLVFAIYCSGASKPCRRVMYCWTLSQPTDIKCVPFYYSLNWAAATCDVRPNLQFFNMKITSWTQTEPTRCNLDGTARRRVLAILIENTNYIFEVILPHSGDYFE